MAALFLLALFPWVHGQTLAQSEQHETGQAQMADRLRPYRIRLLPPSSFPDLPPAVASQLNARHCLIPQTFEARQPENVIHGSFSRKGSNDWAALCSVNGTTNLLVFFDENARSSVLATLKDTDRMASETAAQPLGSAWGIKVISPEMAEKMPEIPRHFDHDAIKDEWIERSWIVRYFRDGAWQSFEGEN